MRKQICKIINTFKPFGLVLNREGDLTAISRKSKVYEKIITTFADRRHLNPISYSCIIFSKDRALQLHALLCSFTEFVRTPVTVHVLYSASTDRHYKAYQQVFDLHRNRLASVVNQVDFQNQVIELLSKIDTNRLFFLVDDIIVTREVSFDYLSKLSILGFVPSLRLAPHLQYCYTLEKEQPVPAHTEYGISNNQYFFWSWADGLFDWNYPLSLDGHVFDTLEIKTIIENCNFKTPNSLEKALQEYISIFMPRFGVCWNESRIVNIPLNKVQCEIDNICGSVHQDQLLDAWERGLEIDFKKLSGFRNRSAHQECEISLIKRPGS